MAQLPGCKRIEDDDLYKAFIHFPKGLPCTGSSYRKPFNHWNDPVDFTRQPIIESIITPKEGCKLVVRSSKGVAQEEFFVDSLEVVSFSNFLFYRSLERPKCFMVPVTDYEVLEVREARMVLKNVGVDRTIKIGGGRVKSEPQPEREKPEVQATTDEESSTKSKTDPKGADKKRERRRHGRRRRGRDELPGRTEEEGQGSSEAMLTEEANEPVPLPQPREFDEQERRESPPPFSSILPPPSRLISETLERYREDESFRGVFLPRPTIVHDETVDDEEDEEQIPIASIQESAHEHEPAEESIEEPAREVVTDE